MRTGWDLCGLCFDNRCFTLFGREAFLPSRDGEGQACSTGHSTQETKSSLLTTDRAQGQRVPHAGPCESDTREQSDCGWQAP